MKKITLLALVLALCAALSLGCSDGATPAATTPAATPEATVEATPSPEPEATEPEGNEPEDTQDPAAQEAKITVKIVAESQEIDETFEITTSAATLEDVLKENAEELGAKLEESAYGAYVTAMGGYEADASGEFFEVFVNGESSMVGVSEIEIKDGEEYSFVLTSFA